MPYTTAIIGLGLVGSSIGLALKRTAADFRIIGHDQDPDAARRSSKAGCVDHTEWNLISACESAELIVIATPVGEIQGTLHAVAQYLQKDCVITDTAELKAPVLAWAQQALPPTAHFVGGHPIAPSRAGTGEQADTARAAPVASARLFEGGVYCLTPATDTPPGALQTVTNLALAVGARPYYLDAAEHDGLIAALEGVPLLLAAALQSMAGKSPSTRELRRLTGAAFDAVTQPLGGKADDLAEMLALNTENVARWSDALQGELSTLRDLAASGDREPLRAYLSDALEAHTNWASAGAEEDTIDYSDFGAARMMFGDTFKPRRHKDG